MHSLPGGLLSSDFLTKTLYAFLFSKCHMPLPSHFPWLDHPKNIWWGWQIMNIILV
jgi:hypothetical protein